MPPLELKSSVGETTLEHTRMDGPGGDPMWGGRTGAPILVVELVLLLPAI